MIRDAIDSFADIFSPPFRRVMWKSLLLTILVLVIGGYALDRLALSFVHIQTGWIAFAISVLIGLGFTLGLVFLAAPTTSLVASFYLDEIADLVEREVDPLGVPGRPAPMFDVVMFALRYAGLTLLVMIIGLALFFVPGVGVIAWIAANAYLLGREYFELAAMRFRSASDARAMRKYFSPRVYFAGLFIAGFVSIPLLNLFTPLFATALMTRLHKRLAAGV